jgi:hypothetical protein
MTDGDVIVDAHLHVLHVPRLSTLKSAWPARD